MTLDPLLSSLIIATLVIIGIIVILPIIRPLFNPIVQNLMQAGPEQKFVLRGILGVGILAFIAIIIAAITLLTRTDNTVTPEPVDTLPTTFPEEEIVP